MILQVTDPDHSGTTACVLGPVPIPVIKTTAETGCSTEVHPVSGCDWLMLMVSSWHTHTKKSYEKHMKEFAT